MFNWYSCVAESMTLLGNLPISHKPTRVMNMIISEPGNASHSMPWQLCKTLLLLLHEHEWMVGDRICVQGI